VLEFPRGWHVVVRTRPLPHPGGSERAPHSQTGRPFHFPRDRADEGRHTEPKTARTLPHSKLALFKRWSMITARPFDGNCRRSHPFLGRLAGNLGTGTS